MNSPSAPSVRPSVYFKRAVAEVLEIPGCKTDYRTGGYATFVTPLFYIRVLDNLRVADDDHVQIQLAVKKTFDRWANSVDFVTDRSKSRRCYYPLFRPQYDWAKRVLRSHLFDFNSYIGSIRLPWFDTGRNN